MYTSVGSSVQFKLPNKLDTNPNSPDSARKKHLKRGKLQNMLKNSVQKKRTASQERAERLE